MRTLIALLWATALVAGSDISIAADDWSFIAGKYALKADDCAKLSSGEPFSKAWIDALDQEVLTREGVTSPRYTHCRFKSSSGGPDKWTIKSSCEELGEASDVDVGIARGDNGALIVTQEEWFGPAMTFVPCGQ